MTSTPTTDHPATRKPRPSVTTSQLRGLLAIDAVGCTALGVVAVAAAGSLDDRARPTAEMVLRLADQLDVPLPERNQLLLAAGFAPRFSARSVDDASLEVVMSGLRHLLGAHLPYPALLLDETWDVVDANRAVDALLVGCSPSLLEPPLNALRLALHPDGMAPRIRNLAAWAGRLIRQVEHRAEHTRDPRLCALAEELWTYVGHGPTSAYPDHPAGPVLAMELATDDGELSFFSIAARIETPTDSTLQGLHLETFLPADESTRAALAASLVRGA